MVKEKSLKERLTKIADEKAEVEEKPQKLSVTNGRTDLENFNTRLIPEIHTEMKVFCAKNRIKIQDFINDAIKEKLGI